MSDDRIESGTEQELGGRLPLLAEQAMTTGQRDLHARLSQTRGAAGDQAGYRTATADGRLIGPFNALLRETATGWSYLDWVEAIARADLPANVREVVVLTVGSAWSAQYLLYAHTAAALAAGVPAEAVQALVDGREPAGLDRAALTAARVARGLVREHRVPADLYADALAHLGEARLVVLLHLVGQYTTTAALLTCFDVPAPSA